MDLKYSTTGSFPNDKFQISKLLTHFFVRQKVIPRSVQNKYFNLIRVTSFRNQQIQSFNKNAFQNFLTKIIDSISVFMYHVLITHDNYTPLHPTLVMSRDRKACFQHQKLLYRNISKVQSNKITQQQGR